MELYNLGKVSWQESQTTYHALAALGREALCLVSPSTSYVCIGFHQDVEQEVDIEYCKANQIPIFRRNLGGGAVYLDEGQLFFHLILHKDNPIVPKRKETFYQKYLQPIINVYRQIGIPAEYKPINDVIVETKKISGTGVGEIGDCIVFVGNLIVDFNYDMMARILKVPDEKFRDKVHKTLLNNLTTIRRELGDKEARQWDAARLNRLMVYQFQKLLGPMTSKDKDEALQAKINELDSWMMSETWLYQERRQISGRDIKIRAGMHVIHNMHKAPGGLIRADIKVKDKKFENVCLSGDFFCYPENAIRSLEARLEGEFVEEVGPALKDFYVKNEIETPGIGIDDWIRVLKLSLPAQF